ncbi:MAG: hypothetical protein OEY63_08080, partial [Gemmatimonadota bacterium]|nr:hypothetical protein [Gemmatimonadota bacterium]
MDARTVGYMRFRRKVAIILFTSVPGLALLSILAVVTGKEWNEPRYDNPSEALSKVEYYPGGIRLGYLQVTRGQKKSEPLGCCPLYLETGFFAEVAPLRSGNERDENLLVDSLCTKEWYPSG